MQNSATMKKFVGPNNEHYNRRTTWLMINILYPFKKLIYERVAHKWKIKN